MKAKNTYKDEAGRPSGMPANHPFVVPDNYFKELPASIHERLEDISGKKRDIFFIPGLNWQTALVAAALTFIAVFYSTFNQVSTVQNPQELLSEVAVEDILEYLDYTELSTAEILAEVDFEESEIDEFIYEDINLLNNNELESLDLEELFYKYELDQDEN